MSRSLLRLTSGSLLLAAAWAAGCTSEEGSTNASSSSPTEPAQGARGGVTPTTPGLPPERPAAVAPSSPAPTPPASTTDASVPVADASSDGGTTATCIRTIDIRNSIGGTYVIPRALSEGGVVIGDQPTADGPPPTGGVRAFSFFNGAMTDLGTLGGTESHALAVNDAGDVAGNSMTSSGTQHGALWRGGQVIDLGELGGGFATMGALNNRGQVVGNSRRADGQSHAVLWENGALRDLGTLGGPSSSALAINDNGQVLGVSDTSSGERHSFLWENGKLTDLGPEAPERLNARGDMTLASSIFAPAMKAYLVRGGTRIEIVPFGDGTSTGLRDLNDVGQVVGSTKRADDRGVSFLWEDGTATQIGPDGATALALNARSLSAETQVVGYTGSGDDPRAFSWKAGVLTDLSANARSIALAVNDAGQIMGQQDGGAVGKLWSIGPCPR